MITLFRTLPKGRSPWLAALIILSTALSAQEPKPAPVRTLFGGAGQRSNGGWGGPTVAHTSIMGRDALLVGMRGGWLIDHRVTFGIAGQGLVSDLPNAAYDAHLTSFGYTLRRPSQFRMGYGGLLIEPIIEPFCPVHISLPIMIGAGGAMYQTYRVPTSGPWNPGAGWPEDSDDHDDDHDVQAFFVVEAGAELEINLVRLVRLGLGGSYRFTSDLDLPGTPKNALHGWNIGVSLKVGRF